MKIPEKPITIKDIAAKANVSIGTVDRVLHKRGRVAHDVEKRVLKIIKELEYQPNIIARTLVLKKRFSVGILIPDSSFGHYWFEAYDGVKSAEKELKKYGIFAKYYTFDPGEAESFAKQADTLNQSKHDVVIMTPVFRREATEFLELWKKNNIPVICFNTEISDSEPLSYVGQDNYQSGYLAGKLIHYGQSNPCSVLIVHFNPETANASHLEKKEQGFINYFKQNNLQQFEILKLNVPDESAIKFIGQMDNIFQTNPNIKGVFVTNAKAFEVARYLDQKHILNVKIVGYDLLPQSIHYLNQNLISFLIDQNPKGQGYTAMQLVADKFVFNKPVPLLKYLPLDIVTKENVNYYV